MLIAQRSDPGGGAVPAPMHERPVATSAVDVRSRLVRYLCWFLFALLATPAAAQSPEISVDTAVIELAGAAQSVDIYRRVVGASRGVAIVAHGFTRSRSRHSDLGRALAEAGVVAVIPDLPSVLDLWANGDAIAQLVQKLEAGAFGLVPVARSRVVLIGTSAGGLATVLAAANVPGIAGWIGLDPVDRTGTGVGAAEKLTSPAVVLLAEASGCNLFGSGRRIARAVPRLVRTNVIEGATHCDFESPTNHFCRVMCGGASDQLQEVIRRETVTATLELLPDSAIH